MLYTIFQTSSVFANIWLSQWTSDSTLSNRSLGNSDSYQYRNKNDYYLGIYGGLGIAQGKITWWLGHSSM